MSASKHSSAHLIIQTKRKEKEKKYK